jgi:hypothetical protein
MDPPTDSGFQTDNMHTNIPGLLHPLPDSPQVLGVSDRNSSITCVLTIPNQKEGNDALGLCGVLFQVYDPWVGTL